MRSWFLILGAVGMAAACSDATAPPNPPVRILLDSLRAVNDTSLPCCRTTSGALTFYAPTHADSTPSPGGWIKAGCATGVPNGELIDPPRGVATSTDSVTIPFFSCETGSYRMAVRHTGANADSLIQAGYFSWAADSLWHSGTLILIDTIGGLYWNVKVTGTTFSVPYYVGTFQFQVVGGVDQP